MAYEVYEVDNPQIKQSLEDISKRIGGALPVGWGFLLMLFEFGHDDSAGCGFYASNADRNDVIKMLEEWIDKQEPGALTTRKANRNWHKVVAILLMKLAQSGEIVITEDDVRRLQHADVAVACREEKADGLHVWLMKSDDAKRSADQGLADEGRLL